MFIPMVFAEAILCNDRDLENCVDIRAYNGLEACYTIDEAHAAQTSSFQLFSHDQPAVGIQFFDGANCGGDTWTLGFDGEENGYYDHVGHKYDNRAVSCMLPFCFRFNMLMVFVVKFVAVPK